jgi:predicted enzyme related to lactoylglutathione lyase/uncharacterized protein YecT (DUF1311 family)
MKKTFLYLLIGLMNSIPIFAQYDEDAKRLSKMAYMTDIENVNCDDIISMREARVCYNLKFQELDSVLNTRFKMYVNSTEPDSLKQQIREFQLKWIENRRQQSELYSRGDRGNFMGIRYLSAMNTATRLRIEELNRLLDREEEEEITNAMSMNDNHINYIEFKAPDLEAIKKFYNESFGWSFTDWGPDYVSFEESGVAGGFEKVDTEIMNGVLVILYHSNLQKILENITAAGGKIVKPIFSFPGGRRFHFTDPAGNELAVWSDK